MKFGESSALDLPGCYDSPAIEERYNSLVPGVFTQKLLSTLGFGKHRIYISTSIDIPLLIFETRVKDPVLDDHLSGPGMIVELASQN